SDEVRSRGVGPVALEISPVKDRAEQDQFRLESREVIEQFSEVQVEADYRCDPADIQLDHFGPGADIKSPLEPLTGCEEGFVISTDVVARAVVEHGGVELLIPVEAKARVGNVAPEFACVVRIHPIEAIAAELVVLIEELWRVVTLVGTITVLG